MLGHCGIVSKLQGSPVLVFQLVLLLTAPELTRGRPFRSWLLSSKRDIPEKKTAALWEDVVGGAHTYIPRFLINQTVIHPSVMANQPPSLMSYHVALAPKMPHLSPWELVEADKYSNMKGIVRQDLFPKSVSNRQKRDLHHIKISACESVETWSQLGAAEDIHGNRVQVVQEIDIGGTLVNQYFYETYCKNPARACTGIDTGRYESSCETKYVWAYAHVQNQRGQFAWNFIRIRGACNCALMKKVYDFPWS